MKNNEWHDLIQRFIAGDLNDEEAQMLQAALKSDAALADFYLSCMNLEVALEAASAACEMAAPGGVDSSFRKPWSAWFQWRPLAAAAAGIVFGMLCTSVVFGYVRPLAAKAITLLQESFENGPAPLVTGVPTVAGVWSGDDTEIVGAQQGVQPMSGAKMLRFLRADFEGKAEAEGSYFSDVYQLLDLRPHRGEFADGGAVVQLSAGFNAFAFPEQERFVGSMSLTALDAETALHGSLRNGQSLNADSLAMTSKGRLALDRDPATWQPMKCELRLPPGADFILIRISVAHGSRPQQRNSFAGHYLDDVCIAVARRSPLP